MSAFGCGGNLTSNATGLFNSRKSLDRFVSFLFEAVQVWCISLDITSIVALTHITGNQSMHIPFAHMRQRTMWLPSQSLTHDAVALIQLHMTRQRTMACTLAIPIINIYCSITFLFIIYRIFLCFLCVDTSISR